MRRTSHDLKALLDLNGTEIELLEGRFFAKFEAHLFDVSPEVLHGVKYSLTLRDRSGRRLMGLDNAHPIKVRRGRFVDRPVEADHWHYDPGEEVKPYRFQNAGKLLEDFWAAVEKVTGIEE